MAKRKSLAQQAIERHRNIPLNKEYKAVFFQYLHLFFKWMEHINNAIEHYHKTQEIASTAAAIKKLSEMKEYLDNLCMMRDGVVVTISIMIFIGMNVPTREALDQFKKLLITIDDNILSYLAIIQKYERAIRSHTKLNLKNVKQPLTFDDIQASKDWPGMMVMEAAFVNGQKILNICNTRTR